MAQPRYQTVLLFGVPGAGKGTQGKILGQIPGFFHLSSGEVFRSLDVNSADGREVYRYSSKGMLVPDEITIRIWRQYVDAQKALCRFKPAEDLLVLDGIPRSRRQAELLDAHVDVRRIVYLACSDLEAMMNRIRRRAIFENRADDAQEEIIRRRFAVYEQETRPVLEFYPPELVSEVDAIGTPAQVLMKVLEHVVPVQEEVLRHATA
jgi:adenylate kinase